MSNFVSNSDATSLIGKVGERLELRPKTWTGTTEAWDLLDPSVQAEYEYVNFTNDCTHAQEIEWDDWIAMTPEQQAAIPEAEIINAPGVDAGLKASILKLLWNNPDPSQPFAAQDITLSSSDYDFLLTLYITTNTITSTTIGVGHSVIVKKGSSISLDCTLPWGSRPLQECYRPMIRNNDTSYSVGACRIGDITNGGVVSFTDSNTSYLIPLAIYGIKTSIELKFNAIAADVSTSANKCMMNDGRTVEAEIVRLNSDVNGYSVTDRTGLIGDTYIDTTVSSVNDIKNGRTHIVYFVLVLRSGAATSGFQKIATLPYHIVCDAYAALSTWQASGQAFIKIDTNGDIYLAATNTLGDIAYAGTIVTFE